MSVDQAHYVTDEAEGKAWRLWLGDSCERLAEVPDASVDLSVYSPPFASLFTYSPSDRDLGNSVTTDQFIEHYRFILDEMLRVTRPGRLSAVHVQQVATQKVRDGAIGIEDFRGKVIAAHVAAGWIFHGEVTVWKNPQALRDGTPVLTPSGWCPVERLAVGDQVIGGDGAAVKVVDVPYKGRQPIYRVTFDDGASVECGPEHLWDVRTSPRNPWATMRTDEIAERGTRTATGYRYAVPVVPAVEMAGLSMLPVHPKLLGAILADGNTAGQRAVAITKDRNLVRALPLPPGHTLAERPGSDRAGGRTATFGIVGPTHGRNDVLAGLRLLGLEQCRAWEKFIPEEYLAGTVSERRDLLTGLLDGDGKINAKGAIYYQTTSARLAAGVVELVNSLGGLATAREHEGSRYGDGMQGRSIWTISVRLSGEWCPFSLARKAERWHSGRRRIHRWITDVERIGEDDNVTCLTVDAEDGRFVTVGHVVTHNSQAVRTKAQSLLFVTLRRDSSISRPAFADYVLMFRKPGDNAVPILPDVDNETWIEWASPVWWGIRESDTLNAARAREDADERHICPLQLSLIERCIRLWSNKGELVLSPFAGIGSEGYEAIRHGRRFLGIELKASYWATAVENLRRAEYEADLPTLFDEA